jgi:hypothetical protein
MKFRKLKLQGPSITQPPPQRKILSKKMIKLECAILTAIWKDEDTDKSSGIEQ